MLCVSNEFHVNLRLPGTKSLQGMKGRRKKAPKKQQKSNAHGTVCELITTRKLLVHCKISNFSVKLTSWQGDHLGNPLGPVASQLSISHKFSSFHSAHV